jgi:predicted protein tyrosine phosphatase
MKILFVCTSGKDRSPALAEYFSATYPQHEYRSAGVNKYFTTKKGTHYLTIEDIEWANFIVYAEDIHAKITNAKYLSTSYVFNGCIDYKISNSVVRKHYIILNLGEYTQGQIGEDYLLKAEEIIKTHLI